MVDEFMSEVVLSAFPCNSCGKCCSNVHLAEETASLDRGDGICRHLDTQTRMCQVYDSRPDICRVELQYRVKYASTYTWEYFVELNLKICESLPERIQKNN